MVAGLPTKLSSSACWVSRCIGASKRFSFPDWRIESRRGSLVMPAWIEDRGNPPRGTVFISFFDETLLVNEAVGLLNRMPPCETGRCDGWTPTEN